MAPTDGVVVDPGRNEPDTGTGGELYAIIGHAPRQLDRNIALVGRVVQGIEQMSSLPRGTEALGHGWQAVFTLENFMLCLKLHSNLNSF